MKSSIRTGLTLRHVLAFILIVSVIGFISVYAYLRTRDIALGPIVEVHQPAHGHSAKEQLITVSGVAKHVAFLTLNGRQIFTKEDGSFEEPLLLPEGSTILEVTGRDKFDRITSVRRSVIFNP